MTQPAVIPGKDQKLGWPIKLAFYIGCLLLNVLLSRVPSLLGLPVFLDSAGTILAATVGGYVPGILVGYITNILNNFADSTSIYYGVLSVLIAVAATLRSRHGTFRSLPRALLTVPIFALIGGGLGACLTWALNSFSAAGASDVVVYVRNHLIQNDFLAQVVGDFAVDLLDKLIVVLIVMLLYRFIPRDLRHRLRPRLWQQGPMTKEERTASHALKTRRMSLRPKFVILIALAMVFISVVTTGISFIMFRKTMIENQTEMAYGVTNVLISAMDPDRVDEYLTLGDDAPGYAESEAAMKHVLASSDDITYVYVYQIREDGCHVVFDPDTEDTPGSDPGEVVPFDEAFMSQVPALLAGEAIEPTISNESYGWLLSVYQPVLDSSGKCVCYACADITMDKLAQDQYVFLIKVLSLFISFAVLIVTVFLWLADYNIIFPINSMAMVSGRFAYDSEAERKGSLEQLRALGIHTGDEIENLYQALATTSEDSVRYIAETQQQNETISRMQDNLITVLADMVESRDQYTGNHIKNTAEYVRIIMEQMKREGLHTEELTDEYMQNVIRSAPLHDIGKIRVSDTILNKPGKLTDDEFDKMKLHTVYGKDVIEQAKRASSNVAYLNQAENMATCHHEKWNGKGYPYGLSGEDIPLSARIMAVADVFDALVSKRSYKDEFSVEKSMEIIREGIGTHFDPEVAGAFLHAEDAVRDVLKENRQEDLIRNSLNAAREAADRQIGK